VGPERRRPRRRDVPADDIVRAQVQISEAIEGIWKAARTRSSSAATIPSPSRRSAPSRPGARQDRILDFDAHHDVRFPDPRPRAAPPTTRSSTPWRPRRGKERGPDGLRRLPQQDVPHWATKKERQFTMKDIRRNGSAGPRNPPWRRPPTARGPLREPRLDVVDQAWRPGLVTIRTASRRARS